MTTLHKAAQAALEALEHCREAIVERGLNGSEEFAAKWGLTLPLESSAKAINDLRTALAQEPAQPDIKHNWTELVLWWESGDENWSTLKGIVQKMIAASQPALQEPATSFDDPRVQLVYETIIDADDFPPKEDPQQHWDGWIARRIVDKLFAKRLTDEQKR